MLFGLQMLMHGLGGAVAVPFAGMDIMHRHSMKLWYVIEGVSLCNLLVCVHRAKVIVVCVHRAKVIVVCVHRAKVFFPDVPTRMYLHTCGNL